MTVSIRDQTPYNESRALAKKLEDVLVYASAYPNGRAVPVTWVGPDLELRNATYPGIYLSYAGISKANDREVRGRINYQYAPPGFPESVQVPADMDDKDSVATVDWSETFDRRSSPYTADDYPVPYNLDFNVSVLTRNYEQNFEIISQLQHIDRIPARFGGLEVPEDGTVRTLDLLGGPDTEVIRDEDGKRIIQSVYSVRVTAEVPLSEVHNVTRVATVNTDLVAWEPEPEAQIPDWYL